MPGDSVRNNIFVWVATKFNKLHSIIICFNVVRTTPTRRGMKMFQLQNEAHRTPAAHYSAAKSSAGARVFFSRRHRRDVIRSFAT